MALASLGVKQRPVMPGHAARAAGQTVSFPARGRLGGRHSGNTRRLRRAAAAAAAAAGWLRKAEREPPRGWAGAGLDAAFRVFHHQRAVFTCHER